ncbi:hypothetical protein TNCV_5084451 [Trichonephila clavipes]|nr:hypothetical protein TNCV_5084451 [Trichonephila clavipes]
MNAVSVLEHFSDHASIHRENEEKYDIYSSIAQLGRSKKRRFYGNRYTPFVPQLMNDETSELNSTESASAKKLESSHTSLKFSQKDCLKLLKTIELSAGQL